MIIIAFLQWWYGAGWTEQIRAVNRRLESVFETFSVGILLRTLFAPWKQIIVDPGKNRSANIKLSAGIDNLISRFVGITIRTMVLIAAMLTLVFTFILSIILVIIWPLMPTLVVIFIPLGFGV